MKLAGEIFSRNRISQWYFPVNFKNSQLKGTGEFFQSEIKFTGNFQKSAVEVASDFFF